MPAFVTAPVKLTTDADSASVDALTILRTGEAVPIEFGDSGLETNARNFSPLGPVVVAVEGLLLPQEITDRHPTNSQKILPKVFFNPGTPKGMSAGELDAKKRIITEPSDTFRIWPPVCKPHDHLVFSIHGC
jgi:hypothetical protein